MDQKIFFNPERCLSCLSCVLACQMNFLGIREATEISPGQRPLRRMAHRFDRGTPWVSRCQHCISAPCVEACVTGSLVRREGQTAIIHQRESCVGCGSCLLVCPYANLTYDETEERMVKCNLCFEENVPPCVRACQSKALEFTKPNLFAWNKKKKFVKDVRRLREGV